MGQGVPNHREPALDNRHSYQRNDGAKEQPGEKATLHEGVLEHPLRLPSRNAAILHKKDAASKASQNAMVMRDEKHRQPALGMRGGHQGAERLAALAVKAVRWLVKNEKLRPVYQRACQTHALELPSRKLAHHSRGVGVHSHLPQCVKAPLAAFCAREPPAPRTCALEGAHKLERRGGEAREGRLSRGG